MILGIESSCDESALALFDPAMGVRDEWVHSQIRMHREYGGVVPDLASREHLTHFPALLDMLFRSYPEIRDRGVERIAVTVGPGLAGCLAIGVSMAKSLALAWDCPVVGVNHLRAHVFSPFIAMHAEDPGSFRVRWGGLLPHAGLLVSGGNTILAVIERDRSLRILAETVDDAAGEALDKGAKLLGLPYPGGPHLERHAADGGDPGFIAFPRGRPDRKDNRFSFSGLKTSLRYYLEKLDDAAFARQFNDICASYQDAAVGQLIDKTRWLLHSVDIPVASVGLSGGVANNARLRDAFAGLAADFGLPALVAERKYTGDNAAMIAFAAEYDLHGVFSEQDGIDVYPALALVTGPAAGNRT